ncbi:hypothetical protein GGI00_005670, partial [Coemansia sp. RSA 2681]
GLDNEVHLQLLSGHASGARTVLSDSIAQVVASRKHATQEIPADAPLESLIRLFSTLGHHRVLVTGIDINESKDSGSHTGPPRSSDDIGRRRRHREWSIDSGCSSLTLGYADDIYEWDYNDQEEEEEEEYQDQYVYDNFDDADAGAESD